MKQKNFDKENNKLYTLKQREKEAENKVIEKGNNISVDRTDETKEKDKIIDSSGTKSNYNKKILYNIRFKKILEEASKTKTLSNSHSHSNSRNMKIKKEINKNKINEILYNTQLKRVNSELLKKGTNSQTIVAGKYQISLSKLEKQLNNIEKYNNNDLNIVKNKDEDILKEKILLSKSPSMRIL